MIEGITVLSKEMIYYSPKWTVILIILGFIGIIFGLIFLTEATSLWEIFFVLIPIFCLILGLHLSDKLAEPTERYEYKVIIEDNVSFTELYTNYEIVDQEGQIYTIKDKKKEK